MCSYKSIWIIFHNEYQKNQRNGYCNSSSIKHQVKNKGQPISFNPMMNDLIRMGEKGIRTELDNLLKQLGYGKQSFLLYQHADIDRVNFHKVSTRIDKQSGKKIKDNFEGESPEVHQGAGIDLSVKE